MVLLVKEITFFQYFFFKFWFIEEDLNLDGSTTLRFVEEHVFDTVLWNRNDLMRFWFRFLFWKSFGSGSGSSPVPGPVPDPDLFSTVFQQQKFVQNIAFSMLEAALFTRKFSSNFRFFYFCITFYVGTGTGTGMH